jgi:hypothetical protein
MQKSPHRIQRSAAIHTLAHLQVSNLKTFGLPAATVDSASKLTLASRHCSFGEAKAPSAEMCLLATLYATS